MNKRYTERGAETAILIGVLAIEPSAAEDLILSDDARRFLIPDRVLRRVSNLKNPYEKQKAISIGILIA